jgi:hypothetical protein
MDVLELSGNTTLDRALSRFKCERCNKKNYMALKHFPRGSEYGQTEIRRLKAVKTIRVPVWRDDKL